MLVKLVPRVIDPSAPQTEHIKECEDISITRAWLEKPEDVYKVHIDPDSLWSPFTEVRGYNYQTGDPKADQSFRPYGVCLLVLDAPRKHEEIWLENGLAWIMNDQGKTIQSAAPPVFKEDMHD